MGIAVHIECPLKSCIYNDTGYCHCNDYSVIRFRIRQTSEGHLLYCNTYKEIKNVEVIHNEEVKDG